MTVLLLCVLHTPCNVLLIVIIIILSGSGSTGRSHKIVISIEIITHTQ